MKVSPFALKLFHLISDERNWELISWDPLGMGFIIYNIGLFETLLMKSHFKNINIASFFRQLKIYGFERTSDGRKFRGRGKDAWCRFQHPYFHQGNYFDLLYVRRQVSRLTPSTSTSLPGMVPQPFQLMDPFSFDLTPQVQPMPYPPVCEDLDQYLPLYYM